MFRSLFSRDNNKTEINQRLAHSTGLGSRERMCSEIVFRSYPAHIYWHNKSDCLHRSCCSCILLYAGNKRNVSRELWEKARSVLVFLFELAKRCVWVYTAFHWPHENTHSLPGLVLFSQPYGLADKKILIKIKKIYSDPWTWADNFRDKRHNGMFPSVRLPYLCCSLTFLSSLGEWKPLSLTSDENTTHLTSCIGVRVIGTPPLNLQGSDSNGRG